METNWRGRLFEEHSELNRKIKKLKSFILSEKYDSLPEVDRTDLKEQLSHMEKYHSVVLRRVSRQCNNA